MISIERKMESVLHQPKIKITRRPALSCVPCRSKKIKCDRIRPSCNRCRRSDNPFQCSYVDNPRAQSARRTEGTPLGGDVVGQSNMRQHTIVDHDSHHVSRDHVLDNRTDPNSRQSISNTSEQRPRPEDGKLLDKPSLSYLKGTGYSTRFFGPSHVLNIYSQVSGIDHFGYIY
jgi:hypothetical protein